MEINELIGTKESDIKETARVNRLENNIVKAAYNEVNHKLASYLGNVELTNTESKLTEFARDKFSGSLRATLCVKTRAGLKKLPIQFKVKASVPTMVETPQQVLAELDKVQGSYEDEVNAIMDNQIKATAYHNESFEEVDNILDSLKKQVENKEITLEQAGEQLFDAGWFNYIPTEEQTKQKLGIKAELKEEITVQAKKKEIDLGVRENLFASEFPVKILTYPKTYLPELKKGDILNVGGLKYKYIGDEPTITGDTENGINARFELVCNEKKASLNVVAKISEKEKKEILSDVQREIDKIGVENLTAEDVQWLLPSFLGDKKDFVTPQDVIMNIVYENPNLSSWCMRNFYQSLQDAVSKGDPKVIQEVLSSPSETLTVVKHFITEGEGDAESGDKGKKLVKFDSIPTEFKEALFKDYKVVLKLLEYDPKILTKSFAKNLIDNKETVSDAIIEILDNDDIFGSAQGFKVLQEAWDNQLPPETGNEHDTTTTTKEETKVEETKGLGGEDETVEGKVEETEEDPTFPKQEAQVINFYKKANNKNKKLKKSAEAGKEESKIKIYLTNLGKYNEGELVGEWVTLPVDDFKPILDKIGINEEYEEWFITDYEAPFSIGEYENIDELNEIAKRCENFSDLEWTVFSECMDLGYDKDEAISIVENNEYSFVEGETDTDLGTNFIYDILGGPEELGKENLERYFDYEAFGRDLRLGDGYSKVDGGFLRIDR